MARLDLARLIRAHRGTLEDLSPLFGPVSIEDASGGALFGERDEAAGGDVHPVEVDGERLGAVRGGEGAAQLARLLAHLFTREREKLALADETLGRYKELTLLYDMSDALSRVLDVDEVATMVVEQAHRFLRADAAALLLLDRPKHRLKPIASLASDGRAVEALAADQGVEGRVLTSGHAELMLGDEDRPETAGAMICAPLRSGETVFGVLRVEHDRVGRWTAGDLKLVTSLAANAASALSHAMLHRDQARQQALRSQIERFVSPRVVSAALDDPGGIKGEHEVAVLFCDVGQVAKSIAPDAPTDRVLDALMWATSAAMDVLMRNGATVNAAHSEMLVALFPHRQGFVEGARTAGRAALELARAFEKNGAETAAAGASNPGVGIARAAVDDEEELSSFLSGVGTAATLQSFAEGRILVDSDVADALRGKHDVVPAETLELSRGAIRTFEVRS